MRATVPRRDDAGGYGFGTVLGQYRNVQAWLRQVWPNMVLLPVARDGGANLLLLDRHDALLSSRANG